jgi:hypothetical protein
MAWINGAIDDESIAPRGHHLSLGWIHVILYKRAPVEGDVDSKLLFMICRRRWHLELQGEERCESQRHD